MAIRIDNNAKNAIRGSWGSVNLTALRNRLAKALEDKEAGAREAIRETYAVVKGFDAPSQEWKYPHHVLRNDVLLLHVGGVRAAVQRARQQGETAAIRHLRPHVEALVRAGFIENSVLVED